MEKRTILAFALSIAVFIIWSYLFAPEKKPQIPETSVSSPASSQVSPAPQPTPPAAARPVTDEPSPTVEPRVETEPAVAREITVKTPLYTAVFTEAGGRLASFSLHKYKTTSEADSPDKQLIALDSPEHLPLSISFLQNTIPDLRQARFAADREQVTLESVADREQLTFTHQTDRGFVITRKYTFYRDSYLIDLEIVIQNSSPDPLDDNLILSLTSAPFMQKKHYSFAGAGLLVDDNLLEIKMKNLEKTLTELNQSRYALTWAAYEDQYFLAAILPEDKDKTRIKISPYQQEGISLQVISAPLSLSAGRQHTFRYSIYYGPKDYNTLKALKNGLDKSIYFGWFDIIAKPLLVSMLWIHKYVPNYGLTIIILTFIIKLLFWPLTAKSYKSMKEMQKLQPKILKLREKHKDNKEALNREMMQLYRTYKVNPMGGCLPMVVQIPVFIAFYRLLDYSLELRHAPFFLWIQDLSAPDRLFHFSFTIPMFQEPTGIPILTLLMGASMLLQQKMSPPMGDPMQAKMMMMMPIFFTFIFINFPSGLVLYWLVNNLLSIGQQYYTNKRAS